MGMRKRADSPLLLLIAVIVALPAVLTALAYASPPDPSWIKGIYDDEDFDNVVVLITSATAHLAPPVPADAEPLRVSADRPAHHIEAINSTFCASDSHPRAPPTS